MTFVADTSVPTSPPVKVVPIDAELASVLTAKAKELGISRRDLIEQMLRHCLQNS